MASLFHLFHSLLPPVRAHQISQLLFCCRICHMGKTPSFCPRQLPERHGLGGARRPEQQPWHGLLPPHNAARVASQKAGGPVGRATDWLSDRVSGAALAPQACRRVSERGKGCWEQVERFRSVVSSNTPPLFPFLFTPSC